MNFGLFRYRKLQFDILSIFLLLMIALSASTLWYTYIENKKMTLDFSEVILDQLSKEATNHLDSIVKQTVDLVKVEENLVQTPSSISLNNEPLIDYIVNILSVHPQLRMMHLAAPDGTLLAIYHFNKEKPSSFAKLFSSNAHFLVLFIDRSTANAKQTWIFKDAKGKTLYTQTPDKKSEIHYYPRIRPWFIGAKESRKPFWTPVFIFTLSHLSGITLGYPFFDAQGELVAIAAADIEVQSLSVFMQGLTREKGGKAYIINNKGMVVAGPDLVNANQGPYEKAKLVSIDQVDPIVNAAYQYFLKSGDTSFIFKPNGEEYLISLTPYQWSTQEKWWIVLAIPSKFFLGRVMEIQENLYLISLILLAIAILLIIFFSKRIARPIVELSYEVDKVRHLQLEDEIKVKTSFREVHLMKEAIAAMKSAIASFSRFIPKEIVKGLLDQGKELEPGGEQKELTIFFSDIYNFTHMAESGKAEVVLEQLSDYFDILSKTIIDKSGVIDKYIGDGVMAFWGAPVPDSEHALHACEAALLCQQKLTLQNAKWEKEGLPPLITRMGINTGNVIVGNIGTKQRLSYTAMGDPVNLASRIEALNKIYKTKIIISENTYSLTGSHFLVRPLDIVAVKGKTQKCKIYELMSKKDQATEDQLELAALFTTAFTTYHEGDPSQAKELFLALSQKFPDDSATHSYLDRYK